MDNVLCVLHNTQRELVSLGFISQLFWCILSLLLGSCRQETSDALDTEVWNLRLAFVDVLLKHKLLAKELQSHQETDTKNKAELKRLRGKFLFGRKSYYYKRKN